MQSLITSLIMEGVFETFPDLHVVLIEGGFSWVPSLAWRLDSLWHRLRAEVPHVKRPPSEYLRQNFWFSTQPMEDVEKPEEMRKIFDWVGWDRIVYSSDYPHWDFDDPRHAIPFRMNPAERAQIFRDNARKAYNLS
jgi:predicted TIM-barrel fold metal-dependent hydrolase